MAGKYEIRNSKVLASILAVFIFLGYATTEILAEKLKVEIVIATYLYQLSKNIYWPNADNIKKYHFHIIDEDRQVYKSLKAISREVKIHGKPIEVTFSDSESLPEGVHVLYIGKKDTKLFEKISDKVENRNILLISNEQENKRIIMINLFKNTANQLRFEINKANILIQSLGIEPDIILLGGTELDVAKLFRESQVDLKAQEQLIRQQKKAVLDEKKRFEDLSSEVLKQQRIIAQQENAILEQRDRLQRVINTTEEQEQIIAIQKSLVEGEKRRYADLSLESETQQKRIDEQQKAVVEQNTRLKESIDKTREQELAIEDQKKRIFEEQKRYAKLEAEIDRQQKRIDEQQKAVIEQNARLKESIDKTREQELAIEDQKKRVLEEQKRYSKLELESEKQQKLIEEQQKAFLVEVARLKQILSRVKEQEQIIRQQEKNVLAEKMKLEKAVAKTLRQGQIIKEQDKRVEEVQKRYSSLARESKEQQIILDQQKSLADQERIKYEELTKDVHKREVSLKEQAKKIEEREGILKDQGEKIGLQQTVIAKQESSLASQSETISSQRNFLFALGAAVFLLCVLAYAINRGYRNKKLANALLAEQKLLLEQSTAQLTESERKYHDYYEHTPDLQVSVDADTGTIIECNQTAATMMGYTKSEIVGMKIVDMYHPDSVEHAQRCFKKFVEDGVVQNEELKLIAKDKSSIDVLLDVSSYVSPDGKHKYSRSIWHDITERKKAEVALLLANEALEKANDRLKDLDRLKSMFIASMSHELRTPLNSIIGFTGIISNGMVGDLNAKQKDFLKRAYRASQHLLSLITDVIDISKIETGRVDVYPAKFLLNHVVSEALDCSAIYLKDTVKLNMGNHPDIEMYSDRKRVYQCVLNLLSNAFKYTEKGNVNIAILELGDQIEITVEDTGIGIAEKDLSKLFAPFERLNSPLRIKIPGTGLGLYLTKKLAVDTLGGTLEVESQLGIGSTFKLIVARQLDKY
jgi:PAS domain S-box-containing protein